MSTSNSTIQEPLNDRIKRLPPFHAVFEGGGPPCSSALQFYLSDLDNKLEENSKQLDSCLQGLLRFTNDLPGERMFSSPKDGLLHMYNSHMLEKDSCYDPETEEAVIILDALLQRLEKEPGCEEEVLQEVLTLASSEGLLLPLRMSAIEAPDPTIVSSASLHGIMDPSDQIIEQRWNKLASQLKKYLSEQLSQLPLAPPGGRCSNYCLDRRIELVESLRVLCSDENAWNKYKTLRIQQLEDIFANLMPEVEEEGVSHKDFAKKCGLLADSVMAMIDEDFVVLTSGIFRKVTGVFKALHDLYLEKFSDEMSLLIDEIGDEVAKSSQRTFKQSKSEHGLHKNNVTGASGKGKEAGHRNSVGALTHTKEGSSMGSRSHQAQSLDSMFFAGNPGAPDSTSAEPRRRNTFPEECMQSLLSIVLALMRLEDHIDGLLRSVAWDITGLPPKKTRRKPSIRGVLKSAASPDGGRYSPHSLQYQHNSGSFSSSDTQLDMLINNPHEMATAPKVVEHSRQEERFRWEWKLVFKKLSTDLSQGVEGMLLDQMQTALSSELTLWEKKHVLKVVTVDTAVQEGRLDYPKVISQASHQFLEVVDRLLPLARVGCDGCLTPVRISFIDTVCICFKNVHVQLVKMSKDVPSKAPLKQMYVMQATSVMIRNSLMHYENLLSSDDGGKKLFSTLLHLYSELIDTLMKQTVQLHSQAMATSILMDADSTDWANIKDFYEDERCSFTIQMWNFHLRGLRHDLWTTCPPNVAQNIFSSVLQDSLLALMQRYVHVQPSFRRIKQYRYDLTTILLCVMDHLLWVCNSASKLLDPGHGQLPHYSVHNLCSNLMAALAVVASPLDALYRGFRRGFVSYHEGLSDQDRSSQGTNTQWMTFFWSALFQPGNKHYDDMQTTTALYLQLTLLLRQPQPHWGLLIQALLMKEYTLSIILLTRSLMMASSHHSHSESLESSNGDNGDKGSRSAEPVNSARCIVFAMVGILAHAQEFPNALSKCVLPAVERCDEWELFNVKTTSAELKPPLWMEALFGILDPLLEKILEPMLFFLLKERSPDAPRDSSLLSRLHELPCGCPSNTAEKAATWPGHHAVPAKDLVRRCLELLIESTQQNMYSLSRPVCMLFHTLQNACADRNIKTPQSCVGLQILAWGMWLKMKDLEGMQTLVGLPLSQHHRHHLPMLADFYYQLMVFGKDKTLPNGSSAATEEKLRTEEVSDLEPAEAKGNGTPRLASKFHKTHKDWLPQKVDSIANYLLNEMFSEPETDILEGSTSVFADQVALEVAAAVMATPSGLQHLRHIHHLICNNSEWLFQQLDVPPPLPLAVEASTADPKTLRFLLNLTPKPEEKFVPAVEQNRIGAFTFDQEAIANFNIVWMSILTSDLGLSEQAFVNLLLNRHEMQPRAVLDDTEKKLVDALRTAFNL
ncbi:hypothetical protein V1264_001706 [Littorina saxatilis]